MRVDFRCKNAFVPQHFLDDSQVSSAFDKVCRKGVPEGVRRYFLGYPCQHGLFLHHVENGYAAELLAGFVQEKNIFGLRIRGLRTDRQICRNCLCCRISHRNDTFFVALSDYPDEFLLQIDI